MITSGLKFLKEFFLSKKFESKTTTITLQERACYDLRAEDYRFWVKIDEVIDEIDIVSREMAIEDHHQQVKHREPHLQFKLHADGIGHIHIFLPMKTAADYKRYILSFLDILREILVRMDEGKKMQREFMIMERFAMIKGQGNLLKKIIYDELKKGQIKVLTLNKEERTVTAEEFSKLKQIPQLSAFFERV